jgi:hypothetical protein
MEMDVVLSSNKGADLAFSKKIKKKEFVCCCC